MNLTISVKQLGKKHPILQEKIIEIDTLKSILLVKELINLVVEQQVNQFISTSSFEIDDENKIHYPKENYLPILLDSGKVGFGGIYNHKKPNLIDSQKIAIQAFEDGIYVIFYGDDEFKELKQEINLTENKTITFIRLTFLVGSYW